MKHVFLGAFVAMAALSVVAALWKPTAADSRIELIWVSDDNPVRRGQIELFNKLNPEYRLRLDPQNSGMQKVIVQCLAGVGPDLFDCYNGFQLAAYVRSGIARDLTGEFRRRGVDMSEIWACNGPVVYHQGRIYGHPDNTTSPAIWYNKVLFDEAGVPYPREAWTLDECVNIARALTTRDEHGYITRFGLLMNSYDWRALLPLFGGAIYNAEGTRCILDAPEACDALQFMQDLIYRYEVTPTPTQEMAMASEGGWGQGAILFFGANPPRGAMALGGRWWLCQLRKDQYRHLRLGVAGMPRGRFDQLFGRGRSTLVNANSKNIEGALKFEEFLHSPEWSKLVNDQADALGPVKKYHYGKYEQTFLHNPEYPEENFNAVWRDALVHAQDLPASPYVNGNTAERLMNKQVDLLRANVKSATEAMRKAAADINEAIVEQLRIDPVLRKQYFEALDKGAQAAWDNEEDAP